MLNSELKRILVLGAHTDDAELGVGGTIARFAAGETEVFVGVFSICEQSLPSGMPENTLLEECVAATAVLGVRRDSLHISRYPVRRFSDHRQSILDEMIRLRETIKPDLTFIPSASDKHQDHQVIHAEGMRAFSQRNLLAYELPWNQEQFHTQLRVVLSESDVAAKSRALSCYRSQLIKQRAYFSEPYLRSWATFRGLMTPTGLAEAFEVVRLNI